MSNKLHKSLPDSPGVYLFKDARGRVIYVGKATSLKRRVASYWQRRAAATGPGSGRQIDDAINEIKKIDYERTGTVIEALIREAELIKKYWPRYNVLGRDDTSFLYVGITRDAFSRVELVRGLELQKAGTKKYRFTFGPFVSASAIRAALGILRRIFPWSNCKPGQKRPCFYYHLKQCPGVCVSVADRSQYRRTIQNFVRFFRGKRADIVRELRREMRVAAAAQNFERAASLRNQLFALEHIQDVAVLTRAEGVHLGGINVFDRIEGYDISNIGGKYAVGSMVVFNDAKPNRVEYKRFKIKTVAGANDVAMLREVLGRRLTHAASGGSAGLDRWPLPQIFLIDGGRPQVYAVRAALEERGLKIPVIGIAKGPDRKRDEFIYVKSNQELDRVVRLYPYLFKHVRDEAHRFAVAYHRQLRARR